METLHVLPIGRPSPDQVQRLVEELRQAYASGADLGSRLPHIRAAADTFRTQAAALREAVGTLVAHASAQGRGDAEVEAILRQWIANVEALADMAATFPGLHRD